MQEKSLTSQVRDEVSVAPSAASFAVALKLAAEGASVVVNDLDQEPADDVVGEITSAGGKALAVGGSVTEDGFAERFINTGIDAYGGVDIIVNNAGYTWDSMIHKMSDEQFDAMIDVHLKAPFQILRAASGFIRNAAAEEAAEGREIIRKVVNISSVAGTGGNIGQANYSSAKSGVIGLTKTLAKEWGRLKVNVNCVAFGFIATRLTEATVRPWSRSAKPCSAASSWSTPYWIAPERSIGGWAIPIAARWTST